MILALDSAEARGAPASEIGGKAHGLAALFGLGLPVPPAVVVPATTPIEEVDPDQVVERLGVGPFAVRSSAAAEDTEERSAAGQFESVMDVSPDRLFEAIATVVASASSVTARAYAGEASPIAVVIQRGIAPSRAGVAFSRDPVSGEPDVVIECVFGHGEALVSGSALPDRFRVSREGAVSARLAEKPSPRRLLRTLRDDEAVAIAELARRAEDGLGRPVDVEFCFEGRTPWLVQARAITTLGRTG